MVRKKSDCDEHTKKINVVELTMVEFRSDIRYIKQDLTEIKSQLIQVINRIPEQQVEKQKVEKLEKEIEKLKTEDKENKLIIKKVEIKMAKYIGIAIGIATVINLAFQFFGGFR